MKQTSRISSPESSHDMFLTVFFENNESMVLYLRDVSVVFSGIRQDESNPRTLHAAHVDLRIPIFAHIDSSSFLLCGRHSNRNPRTMVYRLMQYRDIVQIIITKGHSHLHPDMTVHVLYDGDENNSRQSNRIEDGAIHVVIGDRPTDVNIDRRIML
jgi:hypothetical protein